MDSIIGQDRALSALRFGLNIMKPGFNIYVSGLAGTVRTTAIKSFLEAMVAKKQTHPTGVTHITFAIHIVSRH